MAIAPTIPFWQHQQQPIADRVLDPTPGDAQPIPYLNLPGSYNALNDGPVDNITDNSVNRAAANLLFPAFNGTTNTLAERPADFNAPTASGFMQWHSAHQMEYLVLNGVSIDVYDEAGTLFLDGGTFTTIGTSGNLVENLHAYLTKDQSRMIIINSLQSYEIAKLPFADQVAIANHPAYRSLVGDAFNLIPNTTEIYPAATRTALVDAINGQIDSIKVFLASTITFEDATTEFLDTPSSRAGLFPIYFTEQLKFLIEDLNQMAIFDVDEIEQKIADIVKRFNIVNKYNFGVDPNFPDPIVIVVLPEHDPYINFANEKELYSLDGGATVTSGVEVLVRTEGRLYDLMTTARKVAETGRLNDDRKLDIPGMVFTFQTYENYEAEAISEAKTEEINQRNKLLQDYSTMQKLVTDTLKLFGQNVIRDEDDDDFVEKRGLLAGTNFDLPSASGDHTLNNDKGSDVLLTAEQRRAVAMFDSLLGKAHPLETLEGIDRPNLEMIGVDFFIDAYLEDLPDGAGDVININVVRDLIPYTKTEWDVFATNLSEAAKLLSQGTQLIMDEINALNKEKNRHYQLATNTTKKMSDIVRTIAQGIN